MAVRKDGERNPRDSRSGGGSRVARSCLGEPRSRTPANPHIDGARRPLPDTRLRPRIVIAGGGVAALEALLALRSLLGDTPAILLLAPQSELAYAPVAVAAPFSANPPRRFPLGEIARSLGAEWIRDSVVEVDAEHHQVRTRSGRRLDHDALLVATGARRRAWLANSVAIRGAGDVDAIRTLLSGLEQGRIDELVFVAPPGESGTLPLYELAMLTAASIADRGLRGVRLTMVTPEISPLALYGRPAGAIVRQLLADRGIRLITGAYPAGLSAGRLLLQSSASVPADVAVTLGRCEGMGIPGLPHDAQGFIPIDRHARVQGADGVYAAGDGTTFPIKQGGIAAQQADAAAEAIAAVFGVEATPQLFKPIVRDMLLTGLEPIYLRADVSGAGDDFAIDTEPLWWPPAKIAGRHMGPYLAQQEPWLSPMTLADRTHRTLAEEGTRAEHQRAHELALTLARSDAGCQECLTLAR